MHMFYIDESTDKGNKFVDAANFYWNYNFSRNYPEVKSCLILIYFRIDIKKKIEQ